MSRTLETPQSYIQRNVHLYHDHGHIIGGVYQSGSISKNNFYDMCGVFLDFPNSTHWSIFALNADGSTGAVVPQDNARLAEGRYVVLSSGGAPIDVTLTTREHKRRVISCSGSSSRMSSMQRHFRNQLRQRDNVCALTGSTEIAESFHGLHAAHVYPRSGEPEWNAMGYSAWITDNSPASLIGTTKLFSPQNGLLLCTGVHDLFDIYALAVDPNDNYKIIAFKNITVNIMFSALGQHLRASATDPANNQSVNDSVLRWHFEEAVLANMKGAAAVPLWEDDFGGSDDIGGIMEDTDPAERMEAELFTRLGESGEGINNWCSE